MGFWRSVAQRTWQETKPWLGLGPLRIAAPRLAFTLVIACGVGAALIADGRIERRYWYLAAALAFAATAMVLLLWNFVRAPERLHRETMLMIAELSERAEPRGRGVQSEIDALQTAYAAGRELLRTKDMLGAAEMKPRVDEWFADTAALVKRAGSKNEAFTFATAADFAAVPGGEKAPSGLLLTRLAKLKQIIDRLVQQQEGGPRLPGTRRPADPG